jgi:hypothetical protein
VSVRHNTGPRADSLFQEAEIATRASSSYGKPRCSRAEQAPLGMGIALPPALLD